ncbi:hypothetical protein [Nonomuraea roseoviolacea]|uniref:Uncharacterized protein n=1 Tax=Nonomuraea roseoviolacea subsp. carminata TaxID=160689 RepID=A0ABT1KAF4_9ACTN|nr:hypothetical protein [Nonomuraea roseoviolacea]MCP2350589.1 hypothetical protein [Nonomuraea roseoviolacea subsp. carminata]
MSDNDEKGRGGELLPFPRVILPGSMDAPEPGPRAAAGAADEPAAPSWPRLPRVEQMGPPLHMTVPAVPALESGDEEGAFAPPQPEDPDNPTSRDTLQLAVALMTAMGVAAAQGMWHRARHRSALADQARANADKATAKAAAAGSGTRAEGKRSGSLTRSHQEGTHRKSHGPRGGGRGAGGHTGHDGDRKARKGPKGGPSGDRRPGDGKTGPSPKAPKAGPGGKTMRDGDKSKQRKQRPGKDGSAPTRPDARVPEAKGKPPKQPAPAGSKGPGKGARDAKRPTGPAPLTWKAPKSGKDAKEARPKRWTGGRPEGSGKPAKKPTGGAGKDEPAAKTPGGSRRPEGQKLTWKARKGHGKRSAGPKRWTAGRPGTGRGKGTSGTKSAGDYQDAAGSWRPPPPPPPGWEGMRPPPGADRAYRFERMDRVDQPPGREQHDKPARAVTGAPAAGWRALPAGRAAAPQSAPYEQGARSMSTPPPRTTQYGDAELTIYDVIEADADMAEEITDGVAEARATAEGCERLITKLEAVHAKLIELRVPGVLAGWMVRLMDKTLTVKARANAIAEGLPRAAEAIATAGSNAAARHKPLADAVRDAGHTRPAEREYHDE